MTRPAVLGSQGVLRAGQRCLAGTQKSRAVAGGGLWEWAEATSQGCDSLELGLYLEGTGEPWKVCLSRVVPGSLTLSLPLGEDLRRQSLKLALFFRKLALLEC